MNNAFKLFLFIILSCGLKQFIIIIFFLLFFIHYFMYPNNNLHQKLAINEILNNISLYRFFAYLVATSCGLFFFFFGIDAVRAPMGEGRKTFYKIGIIYLFYTLLHNLLEVKTIFFTQSVKRLPLSAVSNNWFNRQRCHIVKY